MKIVIDHVENEKTVNTLNTVKSLIKSVTSIGNGAMFGGLISILCAKSLWPVKLCACVSAYILGEMVTEKTDGYIDENIVINASDDEAESSEEG